MKTFPFRYVTPRHGNVDIRKGSILETKEGKIQVTSIDSVITSKHFIEVIGRSKPYEDSSL
jgi:hypothetical protein